MASSANSGGTANNINDYMRASAAENSSSGGGYGVYQGPGQQQAPQVQQLLPADISAFLMSAGAMTRSTPGSPATFSGGLGFHSVRTSPVLGPCMSPVNSGMFANLHPMFGGFDSTVHSAVQSANASPIVGAFNRRELRNSMANLSMAQLPPTAMSYMDTSGMFGSPTTPFSNTGPVPSIAVSSTMDGGSYGRALGSGDALFRAQQGSMQMSPPVTAEFIQHVEETKARGLKLEMEGIPKENAKSRVETQIKITLRLTTEDTGERVTCWSHLALPEQMVSREKFRHRLQQKQGNTGEIGSLPASPQHVVHLEGSIFCSSDPTRKVETCLGCIRREYKRGLRRKDAARLRSGAPSTCTTPAQSRAASPVLGEPNGGARMTGAMEVDWDERRIALEKERILIFNCSDLMDFSKGEVVLPTRITCYCRHHNEKDGFCICVTLRDAQGAVLATHISAPIMITDDHKSTKFKTERRTTRTKAEYERPTAAAMAALGDGSAAYASHALGGHSSHLHVVDGAAAGFAGGRQAMSARSSPTLRPYAHHAMLDTYSQFASLAGTPSLGNTPMGSPMMSAAAAAAAVAAAAAQMGGGGGGFDAPFNLPQQASLQSFGAVSMSAPGFAQHYSLPPNSATGLGPQASYASFASAPGLSSASGFSSAPSSGGASLLFGNASGFAQQQQQQQQQQAGGGGGVAGLDQTVIPISQPAAIQITRLLPAQGPVAGGISVLISGRGFHANIAVYFGG
ncbi:SPT3 Dosage dependent suppressor of Ty-induced promoter mutations-like protein, partial [Coemansia sp. RSA 2424]